MKKAGIVVGVIFLVLFLDQWSKIWVKTNMTYGEEILIFGLEWAKIHFVENNGMAFGISLGGNYGKLALSLFRILAVGFLIYYLRLLMKTEKTSLGLLVSFALILAGAIGNILDSAFYGLMFSASTYHGEVATLFPEGGGYAGFLHGKVVDMLYFPMFSGVYPDWLPFKGGEPFQFFKPVFNLADTSITVGVLNILLFQRSFFSAEKEEEEQGQAEASSTAKGESEASTTTEKEVGQEQVEEGNNGEKEDQNGVDANQSSEQVEPKE